MQVKSGMTGDLALLLLLAVLWGASYTFIKIGVETIPPVTFIAARTLIAVYTLAGLICAVASWVLIGRIGAASPLGNQTA
ncbi:MAG: EamA family transporter, partial [Mesorhizobium sp.]|nr:EamA family transporter [Mesorhizobium sp.]